ncbi:hypothetical protein F4680DRAFT_454908 [Xylaria scruposa]|nr:hypothetical protein F4680DRAFT_454908 [Xylaria scruposa]
MNNLPQEIVDHVVSFIPHRHVDIDPHPLAPFAAVLRKFQRVVERRTFSEIYIKTTEEKIDEFERIWSPQWRSHLRSLDITLIVSRFCPQDLPKIYGYSQADMEATLAPLRRLWNFLSRSRQITVEHINCPIGDCLARDAFRRITAEVQSYLQRLLFERKQEWKQSGKISPEPTQQSVEAALFCSSENNNVAARINHKSKKAWIRLIRARVYPFLAHAPATFIISAPTSPTSTVPGPLSYGFVGAIESANTSDPVPMAVPAALTIVQGGSKFVQTTFWACETSPKETHCGWREPILDVSGATAAYPRGVLVRAGIGAACVIGVLLYGF